MLDITAAVSTRHFEFELEKFARDGCLKRLCVSVSFVSKVVSRRRTTGETAARPPCCHVPLKLGSLHAAIAAQIAASPHTTIDELRQWLSETHADTASRGVVFKTLAQLGLNGRGCGRS